MQIASRITDATVTGGTGPLTLLGTPLPSTRSVVSAYTAGTGELPLMIVEEITGAWEHSYCTIGANGVMTRDVQIETSAGTLGPINFAAGTTKNVYLDVPITLFERFVPYSPNIPLDGRYDMGIHVVIVPIAFTPITTNERRGSYCKLLLVMDGSSAITFPGFTQAGGVALLTSAGSLNEIEFRFNGVVATYTVVFAFSIGTPTPGTLQFSAGAYSVNEGGGTLSIPVTRVGGSSGAASVVVSTVAGGTATAGSDYTGLSQTLNWGDGDAGTKTATLVIIQDSLVEGNETINVALGSVTGATLGTPNTTVVTIIDDDVAPTPGTVQFASGTSSVNENAGTLTIPVTRIGGSSGAASVHYATSDGTAVAGTDYAAASGTLNWADGDAATKNVVLTIIDRGLTSGSKTLAITLSAATGAALGAVIVDAVTINDNDTADTRPRFALGPANATGTSTVFDGFFASATPLGGSANGGKAGTFTYAGDGVNFGWIFIPVGADAGGLVVADSQNAHGGFSGATYANLNQNGDPADPILVRQLYTNAGQQYHAYRSNGRFTSGATASYTSS